MSPDASTQNSTLAGHLLDQYAGRIARSRRPYVLGLSGLQGSGKSTLAREMKAQAEARGWPTEVLSLDDFYYSRSERDVLAHQIHPLLRTRGVPGTHEIELLMSVLAAMPQASEKLPVSYPRFDKGHDTRMAPSKWPRVARPPKLVILEGWALGLRPQLLSALEEPVNSLERDEDPEGIWRHWVNKQLRGYQPLWRKLDALIVLQAPNWDIVRKWRSEQEEELLARHAPLAMDATAMVRFLAHYERLSRHALATLPDLADTTVEYDNDRHVIAVNHS
jgi:D-glycerate 3-kinase